MKLTGFACWAIIAPTGLRKEVNPEPHPLNMQSKGRKKVEKILKRAAPCTLSGYLPNPDNGMAICFNHPSLGEILRFIYICVQSEVKKINLFPVNLPWYEAIMPIVNELEEIGIYVMPVITPSTLGKMAKKADEATMKVVNDLSVALNALYLQKCVEFINAGNRIWVAPTATRQRTVFKSKACEDKTEEVKPQTMTFLTLALRRSGNCLFQTVGVKPPDDFSRGLNLFKNYDMKVGTSIPLKTALEEARHKLPCGGSELEHGLLSKIADAVKSLRGRDLVWPGSEKEL